MNAAGPGLAEDLVAKLLDPPEATAIGRLLSRVARGFAMAGGVTFSLLIAMSLISLIGRKLASAPIQGDMELMEMAAAFGASTFLPYCAIRDHHLKVEVLSDWFLPGLRRVLDALAYALLTIVALLFTWRTTLQAIDLRVSGDTTTLLAVPLWIPVALLVPSFALLAACAMYRAISKPVLGVQY